MQQLAKLIYLYPGHGGVVVKGSGFKFDPSHYTATLDKLFTQPVRKSTENHLTHLVPKWLTQN